MGPDRAGWILLGESSTTAAPILETADFCVENWRSAEVGYSGLDIQVKPALEFLQVNVDSVGLPEDCIVYVYTDIGREHI